MSDVAIKKPKQSIRSTLQKYSTNPSAEINFTIQKRKKTVEQNKAMLITDAESGELTNIAERSITFVETKEVDDEQFIKLYAMGIKQLANLTKSGFELFQVIYKMMLEKQDNDKIYLEYNSILSDKKYSYEYSQKTFIQGINDLLCNEIIFQSTSPFMYFLNLKLFYNGQRINIVKSYKRKSAKEHLTDQQELSLE